MERVKESSTRRSIGIECLAGSLFGVVLLWSLSVGVTLGATTTYKYDALGRLVAVVTDDEVVTEHVYDSAGNRTQTTTATIPGVPASISVPSSSTTGNYTISWGAASGTVTAYQLYQATNSSFSSQVQVYSGTGTSVALSGRGNGTHYYRVRACNTTAACSEYRAGSNGTAVTLPPGVPASITVPSGSTTGSYTINWGASAGTVTAYQLYEATNSSFSGEQQVYSGMATSAALSGRGNGTYYYRVRGCNTAAACSDHRTGSNAITVTLPPGAPSSISVPASSSVRDYTISWGPSTGTVTAYELYEGFDPNFLYQVQLYSGTGTSVTLTNHANGTYYYQVRACNTPAVCSGFSAGPNALLVDVPIQVLSPTIFGGEIFEGGITNITTLANLVGNTATIESFSVPSCPVSAQIQSGAQSVRWSNGNYYYYQCEPRWQVQCTASFVIRNSWNGRLHNGTAIVIASPQPMRLPPTMNCP